MKKSPAQQRAVKLFLLAGMVKVLSNFKNLSTSAEAIAETVIIHLKRLQEQLRREA